MTEAGLLGFATVYGHAYSASRERAQHPDEAREEAADAMKHFMETLEDIERNPPPKMGSGGKG